MVPACPDCDFHRGDDFLCNHQSNGHVRIKALKQINSNFKEEDEWKN